MRSIKGSLVGLVLAGHSGARAHRRVRTWWRRRWWRPSSGSTPAFRPITLKNSISSPSVIHLDEGTFDQTVRDSKVPVLVDFWSAWCTPCRMIAPVLEEIAEEQAEAVRIVKVDVDNNPELSNRSGIRNIPTLLFFKGGELKDQVVGLTSKADLISRLNALK